MALIGAAALALEIATDLGGVLDRGHDAGTSTLTKIQRQIRHPAFQELLRQVRGEMQPGGFFLCTLSTCETAAPLNSHELSLPAVADPAAVSTAGLFDAGLLVLTALRMDSPTSIVLADVGDQPRQASNVVAPLLAPRCGAVQGMPAHACVPALPMSTTGTPVQPPTGLCCNIIRAAAPCCRADEGMPCGDVEAKRIACGSWKQSPSPSLLVVGERRK